MGGVAQSWVDGFSFDADFDMHSFCTRCGGHKKRMPFGKRSDFFDSRPCHRCGNRGIGRQVVARRAKVGRWFWQRGWVDEGGARVDVPEVNQGAEAA